MMKIKNLTAIFILAIVMMFSLNGCVSVSFSNGSGQNGSINGKGEMITKNFPVSEYTSVVVDANVAIVYSEIQAEDVTVEIQENLLEYLDISVSNGELTVRSTKDFITSDSKTPVVSIAAPGLNELIIHGNVEMKDSDPIKSDKLHLAVEGALKGSLNVDTDHILVDLEGIGDFAISGRADQADVTVNGAATLDALELETKISSLQLDGTGHISLSCSDTLDIQIDGAGTVNYRGTPLLSQQISGVGSVSQIQ